MAMLRYLVFITWEQVVMAELKTFPRYARYRSLVCSKRAASLLLAKTLYVTSWLTV
jgi:hypothetical protein